MPSEGDYPFLPFVLDSDRFTVAAMLRACGMLQPLESIDEWIRNAEAGVRDNARPDLTRAIWLDQDALWRKNLERIAKTVSAAKELSDFQAYALRREGFAAAPIFTGKRGSQWIALVARMPVDAGLFPKNPASESAAPDLEEASKGTVMWPLPGWDLDSAGGFASGEGAQRDDAIDSALRRAELLHVDLKKVGFILDDDDDDDPRREAYVRLNAFLSRMQDARRIYVGWQNLLDLFFVGRLDGAHAGLHTRVVWT